MSGEKSGTDLFFYLYYFWLDELRTRGVGTHRVIGGRECDDDQLLGQLRKLLKL